MAKKTKAKLPRPSFGAPPFRSTPALSSFIQQSGGLAGIAPPAMPDFAQILAQDPFYQAALANLNAQGIYDKASRDAAIRQALVRFGYMPEAVAGMSFQDPVAGQPGHFSTTTLQSLIDPTTRSLGEQNTKAGLSIWARLMDAANQTQKRAVDVLGSRGMFRSGETGYQLGRASLYADQARYDATNKLMDFLLGAQQAFISAEMQRQALLLQEQIAAAGRSQPTQPSPPTSPPNQPHPPAPPPDRWCHPTQPRGAADTSRCHPYAPPARPTDEQWAVLAAARCSADCASRPAES